MIEKLKELAVEVSIGVETDDIFADDEEGEEDEGEGEEDEGE